MSISMESVLGCRWHGGGFLGRSQQVVDVGRVVLGHTALTNGKAVAELDNHAIDEFFDELRLDEARGGLKEHCYFAGEIAYKLAVLVNEKIGAKLNPQAQKAALKLHDLGRTAIHSFMETDELTDIFWQQIGLRADLKGMTHSAHLYWDDKTELDFDRDITVPMRISIVSDIFGKWSQVDQTRLRHKEEVLEAVKEGKKKYLNKPNATRYEQELVNRLPSYTQKEQYAISHTLAWFEEIEVDVNEVIDQVSAEYQKKVGTS